MSQRSFFSVSYDLIVTGGEVPFDLFVNASALEEKKHFVRVFPQGETLTENDLEVLKSKYIQLYIPEDQRNLYMKSLVKTEQIADVEATSFIKESAILYLHQVFDKDKEFSTELLSETIEQCRDAVESMIDVLDDYNIDSLRNLIGSLSVHDFYTYDHSINVSMYCITILRALNPDAKRIELLHAGLGGLLHDLGKVKIPTTILNNPGSLSNEEYEVIKKHPKYGIDLLVSGECQVGEDIDLEVIARIVHEHHENWNGQGYPQKLKEKQIHVLARICTIADFFDAVTTKRSYNEVLTVSQALDVMEKFSGVKLDPKIFKVFTQHVQHSKIKTTKELKLSDRFDPTLPYKKLPLEEVKETEEEDYGKIRLIEEKTKKKI